LSPEENRLEQLRDSQRDPEWHFTNFCKTLPRFGFQMRISGSHHFFRKSGIPEAINLQPADGKAKTYQVRQARKVLQKNDLI
jgi:hypothetical protein